MSEIYRCGPRREAVSSATPKLGATLRTASSDGSPVRERLVRKTVRNKVELCARQIKLQLSRSSFVLRCAFRIGRFAAHVRILGGGRVFRANPCASAQHWSR